PNRPFRPECGESPRKMGPRDGPLPIRPWRSGPRDPPGIPGNPGVPGPRGRWGPKDPTMTRALVGDSVGSPATLRGRRSTPACPSIARGSTADLGTPRGDPIRTGTDRSRGGSLARSMAHPKTRSEPPIDPPPAPGVSWPPRPEGVGPSSTRTARPVGPPEYG